MDIQEIKDWMKEYIYTLHNNEDYETMYVWYFDLADEAYVLLNALLKEKENECNTRNDISK